MPPDRHSGQPYYGSDQRSAFSDQERIKNRGGREFFAIRVFLGYDVLAGLITELAFRSVRGLTRAKTEMLRGIRERLSGPCLRHKTVFKKAVFKKA
jgi:hypothetical protein